MKKTIVITIAIMLSCHLTNIAAEDKTIDLTTIGQGTTLEQAKQNALRDALEQTFGAFVSSNTSILNDNLVKDEIVTVSSGNIKKYEVLSQNQIDENNWLVTIKSTVSPSNLVKFCESKGVKAEFKGSLFAANIKFIELNKLNEEKTMEHFLELASNLIPKIFTRTIKVNEPQNMVLKHIEGKQNKEMRNKGWGIAMQVNCLLNDNATSLFDQLVGIMNGLSLSTEELKNYSSLNIETYEYYVLYNKNALVNTSAKNKEKARKSEDTESNGLTLGRFNFRSTRTVNIVKMLISPILHSRVLFFTISNGQESINAYDLQCEGVHQKFYKINGKYEYIEPRGYETNQAESNEISSLVIKKSKFYFKGVKSNYSPNVLSRYVDNDASWIYARFSGRTAPTCMKFYEANEKGLEQLRIFYGNEITDWPIEKLGFLGALAQQSNLNITENDLRNIKIINLYDLQKKKVKFTVEIENILPLEDLTKISEFDVKPIFK
jgi:hypothetical protein